MNNNSLTRIFIVLAAVFEAALLCGTLYDLPVAQALYIKACRPAMVIGFTGFALYFACCTFFLGVLFRQLLNSSEKALRRAVVVAVFVYLYLSTAILLGAGILNDRLFTGVFAFPVTFGSCLCTGSVFYIPLFIFGAVSNGTRYDKELVKKAVKLVIIMTFVFLLSTYLNCTVIRPHYRLLADPAAEFTPWYQLKGTGKLFISIPDLISSHPGSFTSGHAMYGILFLVLFPSLSEVFPSLKGKEKILMITGGAIGLAVMFSRMITGDNYLSDIALGAIAAIKMCFSYALPKKGSRLKTIWQKAAGLTRTGKAPDAGDRRDKNDA